ncbi:probable RNA-directed DNA polymerase from transposon X-element [Trichonephila clavipes]|nr:probable RNA-directed DNA polymerase from transposon X-element [Trichonephila clavipes]
MVQNREVDEAVFHATEAIRNAADAAIPKTSNSPRKLCKPRWNASCQKAKKEQRRAWGIFRRYPTTDNLIAFKRAKALARRIRRQCQRESWVQYVSSITSSTTSQQLWRKVKAANGLYRDFNIPILETSTALYSSPLDVANLIGKTFASVSSSDSYSPAFQATKNRLERTPINFRCRQPLQYNCDFDMFELKRALSSAHNTSPGPDGISYVMLRHLCEDSLVSLLYLFNRIWREQVYPTQWQEAIVIPILKPGKDPKNPLRYRPIALTSCLCKTLERMVNARLVYQLEKNKCIPLFKSGFRKGRSTLDNIITLENKIRNAFVRRNHLVSIFFDIEKAYDRTWRYGILRTLFNFGLRGNLPTFIKTFLNLRTFRVRLGGTLSAPFTQAEGVPQGNILSFTLFICHISSILNILSPSIQASLYVDDLQISCEGSDMRMIERQLQTAVNNIIKWCDTNGHSISASKSCCVHFCRKRGIHPDPEIRIRDIQIPVVPDAIVLSRIDYGCVAYGSACNSTLQKLDPVHHMALRICSGAFRTSPVQSLYVNCHQLPLDLRRRKLSLAFYFTILSVPSHPLQNVYMSTSMKRLYDARPSNIRPFMDRMKLHISELDLPNVHIQQRNLFLFQPWNTPRFHYINPFATYSKSTVAPVVFQRAFTYHRSQYSRYSAIYTDGSKRADYVGCGVVIEDIMHGYRLDTSCSIFTAEAVAIYRALQLIDSTMPRKYCIYTDSMSVLEALENYHDRCHPVVCTILDITNRLYSKGFDIVFCWLPSHVGIIGNEQADNAAKSATTHLPLAVPLSDMKRVIMHHIFKIWQESWSQQLDNKLHSVKPVIGAWPVMPMRRTDVKLTRLRIGHTRFTHRHLLFGERAPECPSCHVSYTVHHILIDCPVFNNYRITFFNSSHLTLPDLYSQFWLLRHKTPHSLTHSVNCLEITFNPLHRDKLYIVSWNADGIQRKIEELENYINDNSPDIIALQETNLRPCIDLNIPNYSTHSNDRLTHRGGGTAILVKNSIAHHVINIYTTAVNITAIEIEGPTNNITVCSLYRSPSSPINSFIPDLIKIFRNRAQCIVVGDYNARHPTWNPNRRGNTAGTRLFHYANTCGLVISAPTDFTRIPQQQNHQPSVIDLGVSCGINNIAVESRYDLSSDHNAVHFVVKFNFKTSHLLNCKTITNWKNFNISSPPQ